MRRVCLALTNPALFVLAVQPPIHAGPLVDMTDKTVISICGNADPNAPLNLEGETITISVTISACTPGVPCQTVTASVEAMDGDTRKGLTQELGNKLKELLGSDVGISDTSITIPNTPGEAPENSGTPDDPTESPSPGDESDVYASQATSPL